MRFVLRQSRDVLRRKRKSDLTRAQLKQAANFAAALLGQTAQVQAAPSTCRPLVVNRNRGRASK